MILNSKVIVNVITIRCFFNRKKGMGNEKYSFTSKQCYFLKILTYYTM